MRSSSLAAEKTPLIVPDGEVQQKRDLGARRGELLVGGQGNVHLVGQAAGFYDGPGRVAAQQGSSDGLVHDARRIPGTRYNGRHG